MISNDAELEVVRTQVARVEAALAAIRRDVKPKNERTYQVMAEPYIDTLRTLRAEIDAYLDIESPDERKGTRIRGIIRGVDLEDRVFILRERDDGGPDLIRCVESIGPATTGIRRRRK